MRHRSPSFHGAAVMTVLLSCQAPGLADEYYQGNSDYTAGNFAKAKEHFTKATLAKPKSWQAHYQLANTFVQLKDSANAKKSYLKCIACKPPVDIKANCDRALSFIASNPSLTAPAAAPPVYRPSMYTSGSNSSGSSSSGSNSVSTASQAATSSQDTVKEANRARIMQEAEAEIAKMRAEEDARLKEMEASANQYFRDPDGTRRTGLSSEEEAAFKKEVEQKANAIRENAKRRAANIR